MQTNDENRTARPAFMGTESLLNIARGPVVDENLYDNRRETAAALEETAGHPLRTFALENEQIGELIARVQKELEEDAVTPADLRRLRDIGAHYAKKGDLLYPLLKTRYEISGPSDVLWPEDDEIRDEIARLTRDSTRDDLWRDHLKTVLKRAEDMVFKESNMLFPVCAVHVSENEWRQIYRDAKDYDPVLDTPAETWAEAEEPTVPAGAVSREDISPAERGAQASAASREDAGSAESSSDLHVNDGWVEMPGGRLSVRQLTAVLNTIPMEISFVDEDNINRYFNEGHKAFKRPSIALRREVFACHPPTIEPMVRSIIDDFRSGLRDCVPVWVERNGRTMLVKYMAVRDSDGAYVGTLELVQDMEEARKHFSK